MFIIEDQFLGTPLEDISRISDRAQSLLARKLDFTMPNSLSPEDFWLYGTLQMLRGMEYHHSNFMKKCEVMAHCFAVVLQNQGNAIGFMTPAKINQELANEATAYLNRLGQFCCFAVSEKVIKILGPKAEKVKDIEEELIPGLSRFNFFRNKHTAHRSIDKPRNEDSEHLQLIHAMSVDNSGNLFEPKPDFKLVEDCWSVNIWRTHYYCYQTQGYKPDGAGCITFSPERDHPGIMNDAFHFLERVVDLTCSSNV